MKDSKACKRYDWTKIALKLTTLSSDTIEEIYMSNSGLHGAMPLLNFWAPNLRVLDLSSNGLTGSLSIPWFGGHPKLQDVFLHGNSLEGLLLGTSITTHGHMLSIELSDNQISAPLAGFEYWPNLQELRINNNNFSGSIPSNWTATIPRIEEIELHGNSLTGDVPQSLSQTLHDNPSLCKRVPENITCVEEVQGSDQEGNCSNTTVAPLQPSCIPRKTGIANDKEALLAFKKTVMDPGNALTTWAQNTPCRAWNGVSCDRAQRVHKISLSMVGLQGGNLSTLQSLSHLSIMDVSRNTIGGSFPADLLELSRLKDLNLRANKLVGTLPEVLASSQLKALDISHNQFTGPLPANITSPGSPKVFACESCGVSGLLPSSWAQHSFQELFLTDNALSGTLPAEWYTAHPQNVLINSLKQLVLKDNSLTGSVEVLWTAFSVLEVLDISGNRLNGSLPGSPFEAASFREIYLGGNSISDELPSSWASGELGQSLEILDLSNNALTGEIPTSWGAGLWNLHTLKLSGNTNLCGSLPDGLPCFRYYIDTNLAMDCQTGLALSVNAADTCEDRTNIRQHLEDRSALLQFKEIVTSELSTELPIFQTWTTSTGPCDTEGFWEGVECDWRVTKLYLAKSGIALNLTKVVNALSSLRGLNSLHLQSNGLTGTLPATMSALSDLEHLVLSGNSLSGPVPDEWGSLSGLFELDISDVQLRMEGIIIISVGQEPPQQMNTHFDDLRVLDLHNNYLNGSFPYITSEKLKVLDLSSNLLTGAVEGDFVNMELELHLDANEDLCGAVPQYLPCNLNKTATKLGYSCQNGSVIPEEPVCKHSFSDSCGSEDIYAGVYSDREVLLEWKESVSDPFESLSSWVPGVDPCWNYIGVECIWEWGVRRIHRVSIGDGWGVTGNFPTGFSNLAGLESLEIQVGNGLSGTLPSEFSKLDRLKHFEISDSHGITGTIPEDWAKLCRMEAFIVDDVSLSGSLPEWLGDLPNLREIVISRTDMIGQIPVGLGDLHLETFNIFGSNFEGEFSGIAELIANWKDLVELNIGYTKIHATWKEILATAQNASSLKVLSAPGMNLSGPSGSFAPLPRSLEELNLANNSLSGPIPDELLLPIDAGGSVRLDHNLFSGGVPAFQLRPNHPKMLELLLGNNLLTGELDVSLINLELLFEKVALNNNYLTGSIPQSWITSPPPEVVDQPFVSLDLCDNTCICGTLPQEALPRFEHMTGTHLTKSCQSLEVIALCSNHTAPEALPDLGVYDYQGLSALASSMVDGGHGATINKIRDTWKSDVSPCNDYTVECTPCAVHEECRERGTATSDQCNWYFVGCSNGRVTTLSIPSRVYLDTTPDFLVKLEALRSLHVAFGFKDYRANYTWIAALQNLETIFVRSRSKEEFIPPEWNTQNNDLKELGFHHMTLEGALPNSWNYLRNLESLQLTDVEAAGPWPRWDFPHLHTLWLDRMDVSGEHAGNPIDWVRSATALTTLYLRKLEKVDISASRLMNVLASAKEPGLKIMTAELGDGLTGDLPSLLDNYSVELEAVKITNSEVEGTLPNSWSRLSNALLIDLSGNSLRGTIPEGWGNVEALINLSGNTRMCGGIPTWFEASFGSMKDTLLSGTNLGTPCVSGLLLQDENGGEITLGSSVSIYVEVPPTGSDNERNFGLVASGPYSGDIELQDRLDETYTGSQRFRMEYAPPNQENVTFILTNGNENLKHLVSVLNVNSDSIDEGQTFARANIAINNFEEHIRLSEIMEVEQGKQHQISISVVSIFNTTLHYNPGNSLNVTAGVSLVDKNSGESRASDVAVGYWSEELKVYLMPLSFSEVGANQVIIQFEFSDGYTFGKSFSFIVTIISHPTSSLSKLSVETPLNGYRMGDDLILAVYLRDENDNPADTSAGVAVIASGEKSGNATISETHEWAKEALRVANTTGVSITMGDSFGITVPTWTRFQTYLPFKNDLDVNLIVVPDDQYESTIEQTNESDRRKLLRAQPPSQAPDVPGNGDDTDDGLNTFHVNSSGGKHVEKEDISNIEQEVVDRLAILPSAVRYPIPWNAEEEKFSASVLVTRDGFYHAILVVGYMNDASAFGFYLLVEEPETEQNEEKVEQTSFTDANPRISALLHFNDFALVRYPGGEPAFIRDVQEALSNVAQVPKENVFVDVDATDSNKVSAAATVYFQVDSQEQGSAFAGLSAKEILIQMLDERPSMIFRMVGNDDLADAVYSDSVTVKGDDTETEDETEESGNLFGLVLVDTVTEPEEEDEYVVIGDALDGLDEVEETVEMIFVESVTYGDDQDEITLEDMVEEFDLAILDKPPEITLQGDERLVVRQLDQYVDKGVVVTDTVDGIIMDFVATFHLCDEAGFNRLRINAATIEEIECTGSDLAEVDTSEPTEARQVYIIAYDAQDSFGKFGVTRYRSVKVTSLCEEPEFWCHALAQCSQFQICIETSGVEEEVEMIEDTSILDVDTTPPTIKLLGSGQPAVTSSGLFIMIDEVVVGDTWEDPGAVAIDDQDGDISDKVMSFGAGRITTKMPTEEGKEFSFSVEYSVEDQAGNAAVSARRRIRIVCPEGEGYCEADGTPSCTWNGVCSGSSSTEIEEDLDSEALTSISLVGPARVEIDQGTSYSKCPDEAPVDLLCDRGAEAFDPHDGILTSRMEVCSTDERQTPYRSRVPLSLACDFDTYVPGQYSIVYSVTNSRGMISKVERVLIVASICPPGERLCNNKVDCSDSSICLENKQEEPEPENTPPKIELIVQSGLSETVNVKRGQYFTSCDVENKQLPTDETPCELGATALDSDGITEEIDVSDKVLVCLPKECIVKGCSKKKLQVHAFKRKGLVGCGINPFAVVGTVYPIDFWAFDDGSPSLNATTTRHVTISDPCPDHPSIYFCKGSDGNYFCGGTPCDQLSKIIEPLAVANHPPNVTLLYKESEPILLFEYGVPSEVFLGPCPSASMEDMAFCGAIAVDEEDGDVTGRMTVRDATPCTRAALAAGYCVTCTVEALSLGVCFPGVYIYQYSAQDTEGSVTTIERTVAVYQKGTSRSSYTFSDRFASELEAFKFGASVTNRTSSTHQKASQELNDELLSKGVTLPTENIAFSNARVGIFSGGSEQVFQVTVDVEAVVYIPNISASLDKSRNDAAPSNRRLLSRFRLGSNSASRTLPRFTDQKTNEGENRSIHTMSFHPKHPAANRRHLLSSGSSLSSEVGDLSAALGETTNSSVASEANSDEVDSTRATLAAIAGTIVNYEAMLTNIEEMVSDIALQANSSLGEQDQRKQDTTLSTNQDLYQSWLAETQDLHSLLTTKGNEISDLLDQQIAAFVALSTQSSETIAAVKEQLAQTLRLLEVIAERQQFLDFLVGSEDGEVCDRDFRGAISAEFTLNEFEGSVFGKRKRSRLLLGYENQDREGIEEEYQQRHLLQRRGGTSTQKTGGRSLGDDSGLFGDQWDGYLVEMAKNLDFVDLDAVANRRRYAFGRNRVIGGLFLHQTRKIIDRGCQRRFSTLDFNCQKTAIYSASSEGTIAAGYERLFAGLSSNTHSFGTDPVFIKTTPVYSDRLYQKEGDYYNISDPEETSITGAPFAFHHIPLPHIEDGFPVLLVNELSRYRASQLLQYLRYGQFLDAQTKDLTLELVTYNPDVKALGVGKTKISWEGDGSIVGTFSVDGMPGIQSSEDPREAEKWHLIGSFILPLVLFASFFTLWTGNRLINTAYSKNPRELRPTPGTMLVDLFVAVLLTTVAATVGILIFEHGIKIKAQPSYSVYDALNTAAARWLLPKKTDSPEGTLSVGGSSRDLSTIPSPGDPNRWMLESDHDGLVDYVGVVSASNDMSGAVRTALLAQLLVVTILVLRYLRIWSFQSYFGVITRTLGNIVGPMAHFLIVMFLILLMMAMIGNLGFGYRIKRLSTLNDALSLVFSFLVAGDTDGLDQIQDENQEIHSAERFLASLFHILMPITTLFVLLNFLLGIVGDVFADEKEGAKGGRYASEEIRKYVAPEARMLLLEKLSPIFRRIQGHPSMRRISKILETTRPDLFLSDTDEYFVPAIGFSDPPKYLDNYEIAQGLLIRSKTCGGEQEVHKRRNLALETARSSLEQFGSPTLQDDVLRNKFKISHWSGASISPKGRLEQEVEMQLEIFAALKITANAIDKWQKGVLRWNKRAMQEIDAMLRPMHSLLLARGGTSDRSLNPLPAPRPARRLMHSRSRGQHAESLQGRSSHDLRVPSILANPTFQTSGPVPTEMIDNPLGGTEDDDVPALLPPNRLSRIPSNSYAPVYKVCAKI
ncbi:hypothetical protein BSKO_00084 [Bryopsis sp. KO-2023]|nr:hypothetical protein BSKO_00084 [Bryopsis sp. KO-2023]